MWGPHRALYRGEEFVRGDRARGDHVEGLGRADVLLSAARALGGGGDGADRKRLCPRRVAATADGIRGRSAKAHHHQPRRERGVMSDAAGQAQGDRRPMLEIRNLSVSVQGKPILDNLSLSVNAGEVAAIMGPNGSGKSTLAYVIAGKPGYEVTSGEILLDGDNLLELDPNERALKGVFLAFQHPTEIPGVGAMTFLKAALNAQRRARGESDLTTPDFMRRVREAAQALKIEQEMLRRPLNVGFSGGEKKRFEVLQMALLGPRVGVLDETDSGLDIDALRIVAEGVNALRNPSRTFVLITHYQRLLDYIKPDVVHVMSKGRIVAAGGPELALELELNGYRDFAEEAA